MATWDITSRRELWAATYTRPGKPSETCGESLKSEASFDELVRWLADISAPGDTITYGGVLLFQKVKPESE